MAAKNPLNDPAVPDNAVDGVNPADVNAYKGFNFDMGTVNQNITCNSCHAGGGPAQFGRENEPLDKVLEEKLGKDLFEELSTKDWFIKDETLISKVGIDGDFLGYSDYDVGAGYIGKPKLFNFKRSGVNDTDCFMCHADASQKDKMIHSKIGKADIYPIMPANPRVMVFKGMTADNETIVISLGVPPKVGETINGKTVAKVDSAYYNSVPVQVLAAVYQPDNATEFINGIINGTDNRFFLYPNNANGATREVTRVAYFEHPKSTFEKDGGEAYVNGGAVTLKDDNGESVYRTFAGFFFKYISTASLMGVDTDQDGVPLAYVRFIKDGNIWKPEVYYDKDEFDDEGYVNLPILENRKGDKDASPEELKSEDYLYSVPKSLGNAEDPYPEMTDGNKNREWGYVCSYCHMAIPYQTGTVETPTGNATIYTWVTRKGTLGLGAEIVKRGDVFSYDIHLGGEDKGNLSPDAFKDVDFSNETQKQQAFGRMITAKSVQAIDGKIPIGYDVHFDSEKGDMTCLSCHGEGTLTVEEKRLHPVHHDFLKGNDWGGHWDQSLDYNPSLKTCVDCHFGGSRELAAKVHKSAFGPDGNAAIHMEKVSCEVCHIPYKTHWTFRAFYDVLGYSYNFDNRMLNYDLSNGTVVKLPISMFAPGFGPFMPIAGYGAPQPFPIARSVWDAKKGLIDKVIPIYQADFDPRQAALRKGQDMFGIWKVPNDSFPWVWAPVIINNGFRPDISGGQKFMYRIADPLTLVTWYDKSTGKVLYTREMAAALDGVEDSPSAGKRVPAYFIHDGKVCVKTIKGEFICDDNGDYLPEIDTDAEYQAMKSALKDVLTKEGVRNPEPVFYIWTAPFSIDHGVLPKEYALGAGKVINGEELNCDSCHDAKRGRLPQANMGDITSDSALSSLVEKDKNGHVKYFGLGREIVTVPVKIPPQAYREAVKVFFNSPENADGSPKYGTMEIDGKTYDVMVRSSGDILVNALNNGVDVDRHLVPIPVESSGVEGIAFAVPGKEKEWEMKLEGIPVKVKTEALTEGEVPRRAIIIRLKNELPELLGFEHLADEIMTAGEIQGVEPVFTPMIMSHYVKELQFYLPDLLVGDIDALYLNYATIVKIRKSEGNNVHYELDKEKFHPKSISMREAINRGWASYDSLEKKLTLNIPAIKAETREEEGGELVISILRKVEGTLDVSVKVSVEGGKLLEQRSFSPSEIPLEVKGKFMEEKKLLIGGVSFRLNATNATVTLKFSSKLKNPVFYKKLETGELVKLENAPGVSDVRYDEENMILTFKIKDNSQADLDNTTGVIFDPIYYGADSVETSVPSSSAVTSGGGGGGCSMTTMNQASGIFNLGVILSGILGLFGFRRRH